MNICHVNLASGYHGGENQTLQLIKQQIEMGYQLTVVANPKSPFADAIRQLDCQLVLAKNYFQAHARSVTDGCRLIHVHEGRAIYWALLQNVLHGVPYIVTRRIDNKMKKKWLANMAYRRAMAVVGLSREIVRRISEAYPVLTTYQIPSSPVSYPVDETEAASIRQRFENKYLVIHAANMLTHKGFDVTIEAARRLEQSHPEIHFALLGDGKERTTLETLATGLSNLSFVGKQSNMGSWFRAADLQVHPSYTEGLGSVILEGLHSGLPVIATNAGGIPDIIEDGVSGRLIEPGDAAALAEAIVQLSQNEALRQRLLTGAQYKLKDFYIEHTALLYQDIYQKVDASYGQ
ncbi:MULTISPECIES: glycosyltransferase family 4 protein [unclassified Vibrio]|uniref:glycosyltransferase family 4 protein n=1 Tax=unclassified Vibrio TaxID=2614977 RepID=UPI001361147F|nr:MULTISPECIES: glycosyltransferase family 4 protein [unclassified Vibrio]NAW58818.1 glycosyltransferase [Vibrio sp. V36_P2S2PM302]NAX24366.1 glycosyltransferase [Vibrio sp. V38_P2S17PM301]NAX31789.1 glycosyltransferase [Vibrio sp. V37_P2S8PM304]